MDVSRSDDKMNEPTPRNSPCAFGNRAVLLLCGYDCDHQ